MHNRKTSPGAGWARTCRRDNRPLRTNEEAVAPSRRLRRQEEVTMETAVQARAQQALDLGRLSSALQLALGRGKPVGFLSFIPPKRESNWNSLSVVGVI